MNDNWIDNVLKEQYQFVKVLKNSVNRRFVFISTRILAKSSLKGL